MINNSDIENATSRFFYFGMSSLAKSIIFRSESKILLAQRERILASISVYYSLFHLSIAAMYFCPQMMHKEQRDKLLKEIEQRSGGDPTEKITHKAVLNFLKDCQGKGLSSSCSKLLELAKNLREFVNYGPRITLDKPKIIFGSLKYQIEDIDDLVMNCDDVIITILSWVHINSPLGLGDVALEEVNVFFSKSDLLYINWCSEKAIIASQKFIKTIRTKFEQIGT